MKNVSSNGYRLVASRDALEQAAEELGRARRIAVDLEADSMFHFQEKVCLLQMASAHATYVVDPLELDDLDPLKPLMADDRIGKVFHGADYDIRSLYRDFGIRIRNLFDTELASRFLGIRESGLEAVLKSRFDIRLDKKYQRKDWSRRPLPGEMMDYAAGDVAHLLPLAREIQRELKAKQRLGWVREECEILSGVRPPENNAAPLFLTFRGAGRLKPKQLAVLEELLQLRRRLARERDRPLFKIFSNQSMLALALAAPTSVRQIEAAGVLSKRQVNMHGTVLLEAVAKALAMDPKQRPVYPRKRAPRLSAGVPDRVTALKAWRDRKAAALDLDPGLLLNKTLIQAIAVVKPQNRKDLAAIADMRRWRTQAFGTELVNLMQTLR
ncbi:MAG: HRDC domain-containing protein [Desulfobacterales bacterium]|nr:HRDC domain-containing protein [Desulfobacterales bacterium]MDJ0887999.1 HRDC domain-containing protein [Desulfobacterales bacterium]MDJ0990253.1 HRDC domain-containing protein [Desulfobacterales bacterium]